jgi:hypothetical protein
MPKELKNGVFQVTTLPVPLLKKLETLTVPSNRSAKLRLPHFFRIPCNKPAHFVT